MQDKTSVHFLLICCVLVINGQAKIALNKSELLEYLAENKCEHLGVSAQKITLQNKNNLRCGKATSEEETKYIYYDDRKLMVGNIPMYTAFQGQLTFHDNTPEYCFDYYNHLKSFNVRFESTTQRTRIRTELTLCRARGFYTNGKVLCTPPECSKYQNISKDMDYFQEELYVTYNMIDLFNSQVEKKVTVTGFYIPNDPRMIYNATSNQTQTLSTNQFFAYCRRYGPCFKGHFLKRTDIFYSWGDIPVLTMRIDRDQMYIWLRYDINSFFWSPLIKPRSCKFNIARKHFLCRAPVGKYIWKRLWVESIPYKTEWLSLHWSVKWSYKHDCIIKVRDTETDEIIVDYKGPCGRPSDMASGNYPYANVGLLTKSVDVPVRMRFRDIKLHKTGAVMASPGMITCGSLGQLLCVLIICTFCLNS